MDIINDALRFEKKKKVFKSRDDRIKASRKLKDLILNLNEEYKRERDPAIMEIMKRLTDIKRKVESRLKGRLTA